MENDVMDRLQMLQQDLTMFTETRLAALDRLSAELDASMADLKKLLEKDGKSEASRKKLTPILDIENVQYDVPEAVRQVIIQVADELDLDEIQAAKVCIDVSDEGVTEMVPYRALVRFQKNRYLLLDCMRLLLFHTLDLDADEEIAVRFKQSVLGVIGGRDGASRYWTKCLNGLTQIESYLQKIADHKQTALMTGTAIASDMEDALMAQQMLLIRQHESLAAVMSYLIRGRYVEVVDFRSLLTKASTLEGSGDIPIHYLPILMCGSAVFGGDNSTTFEKAKEIYQLLSPGPTQLPWKLSNLRAVTTLFWLAEYSSRFSDPANAQTLRVADRQRDEEDRSKLFRDCLKDRAMHYVLTICQFLKPEIWHDPAKVGLVRFLLDETPSISPETTPSSDMFADLMMNELQTFSDAFVTNMPDDLRRLQLDEDDRRRTLFSEPPETTHHEDLHLERFLVVISYAYQDNADAAQDFWSDKESNLYGFLTWVSKRLPTPRVAAFCELLRSIASDEKSGNQAHLFLLGESTVTTGRSRKAYSVSWSQIFSELEVYASSTRYQPVNAQPNNENGVASTGGIIEPETHIMLEAYLRLACHMCRTSPDARNWILRGQSFHLGETLFQLASTGNESRVHASCFDLLAALLTDKSAEVNDGMWALLDNWISGVTAGNVVGRLPNHLSYPERHYLQNYATDLETATGLVVFLNALLTPIRSEAQTTQEALPFPENLGAYRRHGGIDGYIDFVLDPVFRSTSPLLNDGLNPAQIDVLRYQCLTFVCICLETFNENLVALANNANISTGSTIGTFSLTSYVKLHPFARVMDWMLNNNMITSLAGAVRQDVDELNALDPKSPRVQATLRGIQAMNLAMKLQTTYFDIVKPLDEKQASTRDRPPVNSAFASYDDVVLSQLDVVASIASYSASENTELSMVSLSLLEKICSSRRLGDPSPFGDGGRLAIGNRLVGKVSERSEDIASQIRQYFQVFEWDLEDGEQPVKFVKAKAVLDVLNKSLDNSDGRPSVAHCLLGFACHGQTVRIEPDSAFSLGVSLFHALATHAAQSPYAIDNSNTSWLIAVKRGCADVIVKLAQSHLTSAIVIPELRAMEFMAAWSQNQLLAFANPLWDQTSLQDPSLLLDYGSTAVHDFLHARTDFFIYAALELQQATDDRALSLQAKVFRALQGTIVLPDGEEEATNSVFALFDFLGLETVRPSDISRQLSLDSICIKEDGETVTAFDIPVIAQLLYLTEQQTDEAIQSTLNSLVSQNSWRAIQAARVACLEAWVDLMSMMTILETAVASDGSKFAQKALSVALPSFEKALTANVHCSLLAKLTLTAVSAITDNNPALTPESIEKLLSALRVCMKVITDTGSDLALRDVCYRTCCAVLALNVRSLPTPTAGQISQLAKGMGERLITAITEDSFSDRGVTRVSALLFLDGLVSLFQQSKGTSGIFRSLTKLNFIPVLIDQSIGSVSASFRESNDELVVAVAYYHSALSLLLRMSQTADGATLVLSSGFFTAVTESRLFSTDPDIGLDIDNPVALKKFYKLLSAVLRVVTSIVMTSGPANTTVLQQAKGFLQQNRFSMQAVFKRTSAVQKTAGPPEPEAVTLADEFSKLLLVTGFLEDDEPAHERLMKTNGFS